MQKVINSLVLSFALLFGANAVAQDNTKDYEKMQSEMLDPAVQVEGASGVVVSTAGNHIYILTADHVVQRNVDIENFGSGTRVEVRTPVEVKFFENNKESFTRPGRIIARDPYLDLALLQVEGEDSKVSNVAELFSKDDKLTIFEESWSVGSGLGNFPFPTYGVISDIDYSIPSVSNLEYILSSGDIIFGNSGGGLYVYDAEDNRYELAGINVMIPNHRFSDFAPPQAITHMAVAVSYKEIDYFLRSNGWEQFIE